MRIEIVFFLGLLLAGCTVAVTRPATTGGTEVGPGSDLHPNDAGSAWFADEKREISYCIRRAPEFGFPEPALRPLIEKTFETWRTYLIRKQVKFPAEEIRLSLRLRFQPCDGKEDLRFDFGVVDAEVTLHASRFNRPIAFPVRIAHFPGESTSWAKGFVWLAQGDWSKPGALAAVLRHEVGHLLGVGHVPGTVMDENIADLARTLPFEELEGTSTAGGIDFYNELYRCLLCALEYRLVLPPISDEASYQDVQKNFGMMGAHRILGRVPRGAVEVTLRRKGTPLRDGHAHTLTVEDATGRVTLKGSPMNSEVSLFAVGSPLFKIVTSDGTFRAESHDIEYRQFFYAEGDYASESVRLTLRYVTNFFEPGRRQSVQVLTDRSENWKIRSLFIPVGVWFPFVDFSLRQQRSPRSGE